MWIGVLVASLLPVLLPISFMHHHNQYLNCKILHGERFCSLDQMHSECEGTLVEIMSFRPRNRVETKRTKQKGLHQKSKSFCP